MADHVLEETKLLDTVVIRPGDLVDDERPDGASVQVQASHLIETPARVGREDAAALTVATALLPSRFFVPKKDNATSSVVSGDEGSSEQQSRPFVRRRGTSPLLTPSSTPPFHCTVGVRWTGDAQSMHPYAAQGCASDGCAQASQGFRKALKADHKRQDSNEDYKIVRLKFHPAANANRLAAGTTTTPKIPFLRGRNLKPYGVCVAFPVYVLLLFLTTTVVQNAIVCSGLAGAGASAGGINIMSPHRLAQFLPTGMVSRCSQGWTLFCSMLTQYVPRWGCYGTKATGAKLISI